MLWKKLKLVSVTFALISLISCSCSRTHYPESSGQYYGVTHQHKAKSSHWHY